MNSIQNWYVATLKKVGIAPVTPKGISKEERSALRKPYNENLKAVCKVIDKAAHKELTAKMQANGYNSIADYFKKYIDQYKGKSYTYTEKKTGNVVTKVTTGVLLSELADHFKADIFPKADIGALKTMLMFIGISLQEQGFIRSGSAGFKGACFMPASESVTRGNNTDVTGIE